MQRSELQYDLPAELIAQRPCEPRDAARLLVLHRESGRIEHRVFRDLPDYLRASDCLVLNSTKVLPARFEARRATGGLIEGLFLSEPAVGVWRVLLTGVGRLRPGETLELLDPRWSMTFVRRLERGEAEMRLAPPSPAMTVLDRIGTMPLPPYIRRAGNEGRALAAADRVDYQTVYASQLGAVAAPTAGLHFTTALLQELQERGVRIVEVVLHVGVGTFAPIEVEDLCQHRMHREWYACPSNAVEAIRACRADGGRVIAVGTTSVRVLETCAAGGGPVPQEGWTEIFIYPPFTFRAVDALITNFHLPGSTLLALVCAFAGRDVVVRAYQTAIGEKYRFYSYGDAMLIV